MTGDVPVPCHAVKKTTNYNAPPRTFFQSPSLYQPYKQVNLS
jgi:hypothetical protein